MTTFDHGIIAAFTLGLPDTTTLHPTTDFRTSASGQTLYYLRRPLLGCTTLRGLLLLLHLSHQLYFIRVVLDLPLTGLLCRQV